MDLCFTTCENTSLKAKMMGKILNVENDPFRPKEDNEEDIHSEVSYLSAIRALMYLANYTIPDINFAVNLLAQSISCSTKRHWKRIKHVFQYLWGTSNLELFYSNNPKSVLLIYADAGYLWDPHNAKSHIGYVFTYGDTTISRRSQKQTLVTTSSNYAKVIVLHEAGKERRLLRSVTRHIQGAAGLSTKKNPTILYKGNVACITQMKEGYIKSDRTKHIPPKFFSFTQ